MSNEEKVLLKKYKENRKIKMLVQGAAILILTLFAIITFTVYRGKESVYYVNYSESSNVDYKVYLKDNDFYLYANFSYNDINYDNLLEDNLVTMFLFKNKKSY